MAILGKPSTTFWPSMAAIVLALAWVLPNHNRPWRGFHQDAWMMLCLLCIGIWVMWRCKAVHVINFSAILVVLFAAVPLLQWQVGLIATSGQAIISCAYILGCGVAMVLAQQALRSHGNLLLHCMFAGIAAACVINVSLQLMQWFALYDSNLLSFVGLFVLPITVDTRPAGNLLQPNLLATLLVWGIIAGFWGYLHRAVRPSILIIYLAYLGLGLAITQSRIGLVELLSLSVASWYWRRLLPSIRVFYGCVVLLVFTVAMYFLLPTISAWFGLGYLGRDHSALGEDGTRIVAYKIFVDAILAHPWFGYGASNIANAYLELVKTQVSQPVYFMHSHNVILDLMLWFGLPVGLIVLLGVLIWLIRALINIKNIEQVALLMVISSLGLHAMVELPHQFTIFLVPAFIVIGSLNHSFLSERTWQISRWVTGTFIFSGLLLWSAVVYDYYRFEAHYSEWLYERQRIGKPLGNPAPQLIILNQLEFMMQMQRLQPAPGLNKDQLKWMGQAVRGELSQPAYFNYVAAMALNGQREEAILWMYKLNAIATPGGVRAATKSWQELQAKYPQIADLAWIQSKASSDKP